MAAGSTYTPIATQTLGSAAASVTFSSIPSTYTDLVLVWSGTATTGNQDVYLQVGNGSVDTGSNYSFTILMGDGTSAASYRAATQTKIISEYHGTATNPSVIIYNLMNYANTSTYKTTLARTNSASNGTGATVGLWRSTSAINTITLSLSGSTFLAGSTFNLYGILAAQKGQTIMASANYVLLEKITVGAAGASSVTFSGIPQTGYTDLVVKVSARSTNNASQKSFLDIAFNGAIGSNLSGRYLAGYNTSAVLSGQQGGYAGGMPSSLNTANTFDSIEIYIPNYTSANYKSFSSDSVSESNTSADADDSLIVGLWSSTAAITSVTLFLENSNILAQYSTFYLYGVAKLGTTPAIVPYATGGDTIMTDGTYWYHTFISNGTFTPAKALSCDVLTIAGAGGGGQGGGGAGGLYYSSSNSIAATAQTVTIGGGGAGGNSLKGTSGTNSQLGSLTAAVGGGGGGTGIIALTVGLNGGSGGGGSMATGQLNGAGGTGTSGQGNAGGTGGTLAGNYGSGGGGGAGAIGTNGSSVAGGPGGAGLNTYSTFASVTNTGVSGYYAGGGGGGADSGAAGAGGSGGAGAGSASTGTSGTANTGSGGGGSSNVSGGAGGSGLVIVRYAV